MRQNVFWQTKTLAQMSADEWESLCDGCGKCCLHKIEDEDTGEIFYTALACRLLDLDTCRCTGYPTRRQQVPECLDLRDDFKQFYWLPSTCAYRLLAEGKPLPDWHPLITGTRASVRAAQADIHAFALPESANTDPVEYVIEWLK